MVRLEDISRGAIVEGVSPNSAVTVMDVQWHGSDVVELTYKDSAGRAQNVLLYRYNEPQLRIVERGQQWNFQADGSLLRFGVDSATSFLMMTTGTSSIYCYKKVLPATAITSTGFA